MAIRIPLFKGKRFGFERDMVTFSFKYGNLPTTICNAIVDTGCPFVIVSDSILKRTRIPYSKINTSQIVSIASIQLQLKPLNDCGLTFKTENGEPLLFNHKIYGGIPTTKGYLAQEIPSFLGKDFFDTHQISIIKTTNSSFLCKEVNLNTTV